MRGADGYNGAVFRIYWIWIVVVLMGCPSRGEDQERGGGDGAGQGSAAEARPQKRLQEKVNREEQMRRAEAVRRASEELAARGVKTEGYLINLIVEDDSYKVSFVKHSRGKLRRELSVEMRREDFEILKVQGAADRSPPDRDR